MDQRTEFFFRRFTSAQFHLKAHEIQELVSLKYRGDCVPDAEYVHFIDDYLRGSLNLDTDQLQGEFGGRAWLVKDKSQNCAIVVEHETGLEILGAIGSIASLIALIPMISSGWTKMRDRLSHRHFDRPNGGIEVRRFNQQKILIEEQGPSIEVHILNITLQEHELLKQRVHQLETEIDNLKKKQLAKKKVQSHRSKGKKSKRI